MSFSRIKKFIHEVMDAEESEASEASEEASEVPSFDSDEEDEEYIPESDDESEESEDETDAEESEEEAEESEAEETDAESEAEVKEMRSLTLYFDREEGDLDRLTITPQDGTFAVEMAYDLTSSTAHARRANFFEGDADAIDLYLGDILRLLALDELPFKSVEFAIPFFPNISLKPRSLCKKNTRHTIMRAVSQYLEHYA
jgi:hypothetical protein